MRWRAEAEAALRGTPFAQIADFGVARIIETTGHMTAETGTYRWMAPEVIEHKPYDEKADVFSFAVVLWELLTCKVRRCVRGPRSRVGGGQGRGARRAVHAARSAFGASRARGAALRTPPPPHPTPHDALAACGAHVRAGAVQRHDAPAGGGWRGAKGPAARHPSQLPPGAGGLAGGLVAAEPQRAALVPRAHAAPAGHAGGGQGGGRQAAGRGGHGGGQERLGVRGRPAGQAQGQVRTGGQAGAAAVRRRRGRPRCCGVAWLERGQADGFGGVVGGTLGDGGAVVGPLLASSQKMMTKCGEEESERSWFGLRQWWWRWWWPGGGWRGGRTGLACVCARASLWGLVGCVCVTLAWRFIVVRTRCAATEQRCAASSGLWLAAGLAGITRSTRARRQRQTPLVRAATALLASRAPVGPRNDCAAPWGMGRRHPHWWPVGSMAGMPGRTRRDPGGCCPCPAPTVPVSAGVAPCFTRCAGRGQVQRGEAALGGPGCWVAVGCRAGRAAGRHAQKRQRIQGVCVGWGGWAW